MKFRFIEYNNKIYIIKGIGYDNRADPPDVFYCVELDFSLWKSIFSDNIIIIPISEAVEITSKSRLLTIWTLYGG